MALHKFAMALLFHCTLHLTFAHNLYFYWNEARIIINSVSCFSLPLSLSNLMISTQKKTWSFSIIKIKGCNGWNDNVNKIKSFLNRCVWVYSVFECIKAFNRFFSHALPSKSAQIHVSLWCFISFCSVLIFFLFYLCFALCLFHVFSLLNFYK